MNKQASALCVAILIRWPDSNAAAQYGPFRSGGRGWHERYKVAEWGALV